MNLKTSNFFLGVTLIPAITASPLLAQDASATLSGTITDSSGKGVPYAK